VSVAATYLDCPVLVHKVVERFYCRVAEVQNGSLGVQLAGASSICDSHTPSRGGTQPAATPLPSPSLCTMLRAWRYNSPVPASIACRSADKEGTLEGRCRRGRHASNRLTHTNALALTIASRRAHVRYAAAAESLLPACRQSYMLPRLQYSVIRAGGTDTSPKNCTTLGWRILIITAASSCKSCMVESGSSSSPRCKVSSASERRASRARVRGVHVDE